MRQDRHQLSDNDWYWETYLQLLFRRERPTLAFQHNGNDGLPHCMLSTHYRVSVFITIY